MVIVYKLWRREFIILIELRYMVLEMSEHLSFFKKYFSFRGSNLVSAETVEVEFRLSVKVPPPVKMVSSPRLRVRLRWTNAYNGYEMKELTRLNASLAQVLRVRINPSVNPQNMFIYDVSLPVPNPY